MQDIIKAEHLTIGYEHNAVLKDISFAVHEHDVFAIMGASGCGKSTLRIVGSDAAAERKLLH